MDLEVAKTYLRTRYEKSPEARFGMITSSRDDGNLIEFGIDNTYETHNSINIESWFNGDINDRFNCNKLDKAITEFKCQGVELDMTLLAWGTDLIYHNGYWNNKKAKPYQKWFRVYNSLKIRLNAYRVLLTRGRDGVIIFVPPIEELDTTHDFFMKCGITTLD